MVVFDIKVYYDTICPWCYIGHKALDSAIFLYSKTFPGGSSDSFSFRYQPFYLKPEAPSRGIPWAHVVTNKNGPQAVDAIKLRLERVGRASGINFSFQSKIGNTRDSHRLMMFAAPECRKMLLEQIYSAHFENDADITSHNDLAEAAVAAGLDRASVFAFLGSGEIGPDVDKMAAQAREAGVRSVPTVEINGVRVEGAQDVNEFMDALIRAKQGFQEVNIDH